MRPEQVLSHRLVGFNNLTVSQVMENADCTALRDKVKFIGEQSTSIHLDLKDQWKETKNILTVGTAIIVGLGVTILVSYRDVSIWQYVLLAGALIFSCIALTLFNIARRRVLGMEAIMSDTEMCSGLASETAMIIVEAAVTKGAKLNQTDRIMLTFGARIWTMNAFYKVKDEPDQYDLLEDMKLDMAVSLMSGPTSGA